MVLAPRKPWIAATPMQIIRIVDAPIPESGRRPRPALFRARGIFPALFSA
jgi:hypothetical protein